MPDFVNNANVTRALSRPSLRLVADEASARSVSPRTGRLRARAASRVSRENAAASRLCSSDARWVLAVRTAQALEGGKLAMLRPERRRELVAMATRVGLRDFDANLVIAIVQDGARSGEGALGDEIVGRLGMLRAASPTNDEKSVLIRVALATVAAAILLLMALVRWLLGGGSSV
jgi:hypothetical protein